MRDLIVLVERAEPDGIDAYHGTTGDFSAFDPELTGDIGMHFGTAVQADGAVRDFYGKHPEGANIIPVKLRIKNSLRVPDMFSTLRTTYMNRAKQWNFFVPGFDTSLDERAEIFDAAKAADKARRAAGGDYGSLRPHLAGKRETYKAASKRFWDAIQASVLRQGYDSLVYANKCEGRDRADSYVVFDPRLVRVRHATFDPAKTDSANLLDSVQPTARPTRRLP